MILSTGRGLPATLDDIVTIERALTRRLIEIDDKSAKVNNEDFKKRLKLMEKLEAQQWEDRERELERIRQFKQQVVTRRLNELRQRMARDATLKLERIFEKKKKENAQTLQAIKMDYLRRKLTVQRLQNVCQSRQPLTHDVLLQSCGNWKGN